MTPPILTIVSGRGHKPRCRVYFKWPFNRLTVLCVSWVSTPGLKFQSVSLLVVTV